MEKKNVPICLVGEAGPPGQIGDQGVVGAPGQPGPSGPQGTAGNPGPGEDGPPGPSGPYGDSGSTGLTGSFGPSGLPGDAGPPGNPGAFGYKGPPGLPGPIGFQGPQGIAGNTGNIGPIGPPGYPGTPGQPGAQQPPILSYYAYFWNSEFGYSDGGYLPLQDGIFNNAIYGYGITIPPSAQYTLFTRPVLPGYSPHRGNVFTYEGIYQFQFTALPPFRAPVGIAWAAELTYLVQVIYGSSVAYSGSGTAFTFPWPGDNLPYVPLGLNAHFTFNLDFSTSNSLQVAIGFKTNQPIRPSIAPDYWTLNKLVLRLVTT